MNCWWFFHRWSRWRDVAVYQCMTPGGKQAGQTLMQHRECAACGLKQSREIPQ